MSYTHSTCSVYTLIHIVCTHSMYTQYIQYIHTYTYSLYTPIHTVYTQYIQYICTYTYSMYTPIHTVYTHSTYNMHTYTYSIYTQYTHSIYTVGTYNIITHIHQGGAVGRGLDCQSYCWRIESQLCQIDKKPSANF